ncbi:MAG: MFS transporter [Candidatus Woesearchaeota archaeon]
MPKKYSELLAEQKKVAEQKKNDLKQKEDSEYLKKKKSLDYVIKDGIFTSIKSGFTESFIMPFVIALNASTGMIAALASLPQLLGNFFQLFSEKSLVFFKTRSKLIFWTSLIQAFMWLPLLIIPFFAKDYLFLVLLFVTLEAILGTFQGPIYNSMLGDLVPEDKRGEFFGNRNRIISLIHFISTIIAGLIINFFQKLDNHKTFYVFVGFGILFFIAFISRLIAAFYKKKIYDEKYVYEKRTGSFIKFLQNMTNNNYGIFVLFVFLLRLAASISTPFFALYLLKDLSLGYFYFTIIIAVSIIANFFAMSFWGRMIDKRGSKKVLTISAFLVPFSPLLLILAVFIDNPLWVFIFLLLEEIFAGIAWAAFNLSTSSFLFDATTPKERIRYISYYNFLVGLGIFLGATIGGLLTKIYPVWITSSLTLILLTSGILRLIVTILLIRKVREARMIEIDFPGRGFFHNTLSIAPRHGSNIEIIGVYRHEHQNFHSIIPKRKPIDPVKKDERKLYEQKSIELYKNNALKTLSQKQKEYTKEDDSSKIEKELEKDADKIESIANDIKKKNMYKK